MAQSPPAPPAAKIISSVALWMLPGSLAERLAAVARAGIQSVEFKSDEALQLTAPEVAQTRRVLRSYGLTVDAIMAAEPAGDANLLELARAWDASAVVVPAAGTPSVAGLRRVGDLAAKAGVTVLVENESLAREADHPQVRLLFDAAAAHERTRDVVKAFETAAPLVRLIHVADSPGRREPGSGSLPFATFYQAVAKSGFAGHLVLAYQVTSASAVPASLLRSVDAMRRSLAAPPAPSKV